MSADHLSARRSEQPIEIAATGPYPTVPDPDAFPDAPRPSHRGGDGAERHAAERRVAAVVERMAEAFLSLDAAWRVTYANREACRLNRTTREALVGRDHWQQWPETLGTAAAVLYVDLDGFKPLTTGSGMRRATRRS